MEEIRAIIVDDEKSARDVLLHILTKYAPNIKVISACEDVPTALKSISKVKPNVVFLDIEMPEFSGFDLIGQLEDIECEIIFVTAYNQYAVRAFEVSALDYLLKPLQIEKVCNAVSKLSERLKLQDSQLRIDNLKNNLSLDSVEKIAIRTTDGLEFIRTADIEHLGAQGAYTTVYFADKRKLLVSKKIKFFENALAENSNFIRVHRSSIINKEFVSKYSKSDSTIALLSGELIKVARDRKAQVEQQFHAI
jgi:two-component system LytT family response regulator